MGACSILFSFKRTTEVNIVWYDWKPRELKSNIYIEGHLNMNMKICGSLSCIHSNVETGTLFFLGYSRIDLYRIDLCFSILATLRYVDFNSKNFPAASKKKKKEWYLPDPVLLPPWLHNFRCIEKQTVYFLSNLSTLLQRVRKRRDCMQKLPACFSSPHGEKGISRKYLLFYISKAMW